MSAPTPARKPRTSAASRVTAVQRETFLEHVRDGMNRQQAAETIGMTGTKIRSLCRHDPEFNAAYEQALADGKPAFQDKVRHVWHERAMEGKNDRLLWYLVVTYVPEAAWFRNGSVPAEEVPRVDYTTLTTEELVQLKNLVSKAKPSDDRRGLRAV